MARIVAQEDAVAVIYQLSLDRDNARLESTSASIVFLASNAKAGHANAVFADLARQPEHRPMVLAPQDRLDNKAFNFI